MEKNHINKILLLKLKKLLEANDIFFWLDFGTLLGAYREKDFIAWDNDMDISLWAEEYWKVRKILEYSQWKFKFIWRRELSIYLEEYPEYHIDLFFYDKLEDKKVCYYVYLEDKVHDSIYVESKAILNSNLLEKFSSYEFLENTFNIPNKIEEYLTVIYDNWKIPQKKWCYSNHSGIDRDHRTIGIIIPTFLRDEKMMILVNSILKYYDKVNRFQPFIRIYIADQGEMTIEKQKYYQQLEESGHKWFCVPFNSGLSYCRNYLIDKVKEPFILIMDDDYEFDSKTNLDSFLKLIILNENIGIVGGNLNNNKIESIKLYLTRQDSKNKLYRIINDNPPLLTSISGIKQKSYRYIETELVSNFFLARKELFKDIIWDNKLKLVEHTDFFLRLKTTKWKVLFTPEINIIHNRENNTTIYEKYRNRNEGTNCIPSLEAFYNKWNIDRTIKFINETNIINHYIPSSKIKVVQLARIPCANSPGEVNTLINTYSSQYSSKYILGDNYKNSPLIPRREMPVDLDWINNRQDCLQALREANIIHVHHDCINDWEIINILKSKPVIWTLYNLSQSLKISDNTFNKEYNNKVKELANLITVADQSLQKQIFNYLSTLTVPLVKVLFNEKVEKNNKIPLIVFAPTNRMDEGIGTKKYNSVLEKIEELKQEGYIFEFDLIEGLPYEENLNRKRNADIIIDDVDPDYEKFHNTSIEAACFGAIALTNYSGVDYPFIKTNIYTLKNTLIKFITNPILLKKEQDKIVKWKNNNYTPEKLLMSYEQIYYHLLNKEDYLYKAKNRDEKNSSEIILPIPKIINPPGGVNTGPLNAKQNIKEFFNILNSKNIEFWLLKDSCLETIKYKELRTNKLQLGVRNTADKNNVENLCSKVIFLVEVDIESGRTVKKWNLYGAEINVPFPLIKYLERYTGKCWNELNINE